VLGWKTLGHRQRFQARIVNDADDFVICCRGTATEALRIMRDMMQRRKLSLNEKQTKLCRVPAETLDFLGYTFGRCYAPPTGRAYLGTRPAAKKMRKRCESWREQTSRRFLLLAPEEIVARLNRQLRGGANYFRLGPVSRADRAVDRCVRNRLRRWLCKKHKVPGAGTSRFPEAYLYQPWGLIRLPMLTRNLPWAKA
jgi:RNA-directed DNA polymerase